MLHLDARMQFLVGTGKLLLVVRTVHRRNALPVTEGHGVGPAKHLGCSSPHLGTYRCPPHPPSLVLDLDLVGGLVLLSSVSSTTLCPRL